ncbi:MAG: glycosyltransferase family 2 protein [Bacteroidaceae bacterium]|jgi:glycosyltransferase involved in cell wall biosynthesis
MICVFLSAYNGEKYLREQLDSILAQQGVEVRILVRDDGSKDTTASILQEYAEKYPDLLRWQHGENVGFAWSFIRLLQWGRECYPECLRFAFADQDDVWLPDKLKAGVDVLNNEGEDLPVLYCSNLTLVDTDLNYMRMAWNKKSVRITKPRALVQSFATGCTMVFNRTAVNMYLSHLPQVIKVHDFLMYQMCVFLGKVVWDEHSYILYRQHGHNQIGKPGYWGRWKKRLEGHYKEHTLELQNRYFLEAFKDVLSVDDVGLISQMVFYRKNCFSKLSLLFDCKIKYTNWESNFFYVLKILIGGGKPVGFWRGASSFSRAFIAV